MRSRKTPFERQTTATKCKSRTRTFSSAELQIYAAVKKQPGDRRPSKLLQKNGESSSRLLPCEVRRFKPTKTLFEMENPMVAARHRAQTDGVLLRKKAQSVISDASTEDSRTARHPDNLPRPRGNLRECRRKAASMRNLTLTQMEGDGPPRAN